MFNTTHLKQNTNKNIDSRYLRFNFLPCFSDVNKLYIEIFYKSYTYLVVL